MNSSRSWKLSLPESRESLIQSKIVWREEWIEARKPHMGCDKELTRARDRFAEERDTALVAVSCAPLSRLNVFSTRMGCLIGIPRMAATSTTISRCHSSPDEVAADALGAAT